MTQKIYLTVGAPATGKSTWAKSKVSEDPNNYLRINNDDLRQSFNGGVWSHDYEKLIKQTRESLIKLGLSNGKNIIIDNINADKNLFKDVCKIVEAANVDCIIIEKPFYEELDVLLERDSQRKGSAKVGEAVVRKWFKKLGGKLHNNYDPRIETFVKKQYTNKLKQDENLPKAIISDLDGTLALFEHHRGPYDATNCDNDLPYVPVVESVKAFYKLGYKVLFCSGREDKYKEPTIKFIEKYLPGLEYQLFMRKSGDMRKDSIIKEEIYRNNIEGKYYISHIYDDRVQVVSLWRSLGLTCFQVAPGEF